MKDLTTVKQGKATTVQDRSGKCLTEEREILNRWTEYYNELYNHKADGDPSVLDHPSQRSGGCSTVVEEREVSCGRQHPSRTDPSRWRGCNHLSHDNLRQELAERTMANPMDPVLSLHTSQERQPAAVTELPNDQPHQSPKQSHAEDHTEQTEATSGEDYR